MVASLLLQALGPSIYADLAVFFLIGLLGGAHCIGMCGPLVTTYAERMSTPSYATDGALTLFEVRQHALFNSGRTVSYAFLGGLFGLFGSVVYTSVSVVGLLEPIQASFGILVGGFIIAMGASRLFGWRQGAVSHAAGLGLGPIFRRIYALLTSRISRWVDGFGIFGLGLLHGLLPCMLLYPAFLYVFAHGTPLYGVLCLGALGLGTFPTVFLYGTVIQSIDTSQRVFVHRALGVAFIVLGYIPLAHGLMLFGVPVPMPDIPFYQPLGEHLQHADHGTHAH
ncbi:sulfite exporter TauE/SafE family protein (plasmid) [Haloferacaceae archaeon DSL9]